MEQKAAIVTGASSGIGEAVSLGLCEMGYCVYGFGRDFGKCVLPEMYQEQFHTIEGDLLDTSFLENAVKKIKKECGLSVLVNGAGVGFYGLHEEISPKKIRDMVRTNLEVPMVLTGMLLRNLKKTRGYVFNISSITARKSNPHGCAYGATKAGLSGFSASLFEEVRKYGVKVVNIQPDMTKTSLYRDADFYEGEEPESYLLPEEVADVIKKILGQRDGIVVTEVTLRPQIHRIRRK